MKKVLITAAAAAFVICGTLSISSATDMGPAEITLESTNSKKPKPAVFPHKAHQDGGIECASCHHGMAEDGSQVAYVDGQDIGKCESCHNEEKMAGKTVKVGKKDLKLDTFKGAGHANCLTCHKDVASKDAAKKALKKCSTCHPKK